MNLESEIKKALKEDLSLTQLTDLLFRFKQFGGSQKEAYKILEKIRDGDIDESVEDKVLEIMDFVSGYCSQDNRIWEGVLIN